MLPPTHRHRQAAAAVALNAATALRGRVLLVSQETTIFNDTVRNNVRFGMSATDEDVDRATAEIRRVLRPGGHLALIEHVRAEDPRLAGWQRELLRIVRNIAQLPEADRMAMAEYLKSLPAIEGPARPQAKVP